MNVPEVVDRTSSGKEHFEVLDGLRGSAAFLIVIFHLFNYSFSFHGPWALLKHAYLAVDFFFARSGFFVAYAYDDRWTRTTTLQFFRIRLIRLHPLVLIGATLRATHGPGIPEQQSRSSGYSSCFLWRLPLHGSS
jgi:peptidoglycan/LPS O-acetylase OafA/YrhL